MINMSTKREAERSTTTQSEEDKTKEAKTVLSEQRQSVDRELDETKDNRIATTRIANNAMFANMESFKTFLQREKEDVKEFSRIGVNSARTFAQTSKDVAREHDISNRYY